jgi:hypothetical protein
MLKKTGVTKTGGWNAMRLRRTGLEQPTFVLWSIEAKVRRETWRDRRRLAERGTPVGSRNMAYWGYKMDLEKAF